ncbi:cytochrome c1 [Allosphingosinicella sp.]|jgi:ubiquinol-cytochrome c reductase cytochrome c1 subunit|uniref:cytochrome c1 n=1 Tax=Allosphingosinicella sp. TaxID=2823234 RepID=UPI002F0B3595
MVRLLGILIGFGLVFVATWSFVSNTWDYLNDEKHENVYHEFHEHPRDIAFAHDGPFGTFNRQQLQRGFQVYQQVCASCHSLSYVAFRNLHDLGYNEDEVKALAAQFQVPDVNQQTGEPAARPGLPADRFPSPYPNEVAARAGNNNAVPPDLSLIVKARHGGAQYVASLLTGYRDPATYRNHDGHALPEDARPGENLFFNPYFPNLNLAMRPPLSDNAVTYSDGTPATVDQMAQDVAAFLTWTAEPNLQRRHRAGIAVTIFLIFASLLAWLAYKNVWASAKRQVRATGPLDPENMAKNEVSKRDAGIEG